MAVLITGASGFIGSYLIKKLNNKNIILLSSKKRSGFIKMNIHKKKYNILDKYNIDTCIHLAWSNIPNYSKSNSIKNYQSSKKLFEYLYKNNCKKIISLGSCWEYKEDFGVKKENNDLNSNNIFGFYKKKLAKYGLKLAKKYKSIFIWFRVFYVYGEQKKGLIKHLEKAYHKKNKLILQNPHKLNDFIFIEDVVRNIINALDTGESGIYNLGTGKKNSTLNFCKVYSRNRGVHINSLVDFLKIKKKIKKEGIWACMKKNKKTFLHKEYFDINRGIQKLLNK